MMWNTQLLAHFEAKAAELDRAWRDTVDHIYEDDMTVQETYEYVKSWSKIMYRLARGPMARPEQVTIGLRWGAQYKEMAFLLRDALREERKHAA